jgi:hypothetical protein
MKRSKNDRPAPDRRPLPLPHERDESPVRAGRAAQPRMDQAKRDLDAGLGDTEERNDAQAIFERAPRAARRGRKIR